jgi:hypothetical protein
MKRKGNEKDLEKRKDLNKEKGRTIERRERKIKRRRET